MIRTLITTTLAASVLMALGGCNTVKGIGRDIESVGKKGDEVINKPKNGELQPQ